MVRCPQCGRVADGVACFACGYEWPSAGSAAPAPGLPTTTTTTSNAPSASSVASTLTASDFEINAPPPAAPSWPPSEAISNDDLHAPDIDDLDLGLDDGPAPPAGPPPALSFLDEPVPSPFASPPPSPPALQSASQPTPAAPPSPFANVPPLAAPGVNPFSVPRPVTGTFPNPGLAGGASPFAAPATSPFAIADLGVEADAPPTAPAPPVPASAAVVDDVAPDDFEGAFLAGASGTFTAPQAPPPPEPPPPVAAPAARTPIAAEAHTAPPARASVENPFASTAYSRGAATNPFGSVPKTLPLGSISSSSSSPGGSIEGTADAANPFASADGPLIAQSPPAPSSTRPSPPPPPLEETFDPFEGDAAETMPPPPPPLDIKGSNPRGGAVPWEDLDKPPPPVSWDQLTEEADGAPASQGAASEPSDEGDPDRTREMPLAMVPKLASRGGSLLADVDGADDAGESYDDGIHVDDEPTLDTARSPAYLALKREPLGDRLRRLASDLDGEGRHEAAALLLEAARALSAHEV